MKNIGFRVKLLASFGAVLVLMVVISSIVLFSVSSLMKNFNSVDHTYKVLDKASRIEAAGVDMETGMRGYLLAGKSEFLTPYNNGNETFLNLISELSQTVSDNPAQVTLLKEIKATIGEWQSNVTEPTINLRTQIGDAKSMNDMAQVIQEA